MDDGYAALLDKDCSSQYPSMLSSRAQRSQLDAMLRFADCGQFNQNYHNRRRRVVDDDPIRSDPIGNFGNYNTFRFRENFQSFPFRSADISASVAVDHQRCIVSH